MSKKLKIGVGILSIVAFNIAQANSVGEASSVPANSSFQQFDNQIAVGNSWLFGLLSDGQVYQNNSMGISASKLFGSGIYIAASADQAYNSTYSNYSGSNFYGSIGYAFYADDKFQVTPNITALRSQLSSNNGDNNLNDILYSGLLGVKLEYTPINYLYFNLHGGYGLSGQNATQTSNGVSSTNEGTSYGGATNGGFMVTYKPIDSAPWLINANYDYNGYAGGFIGETNTISVSTAYAF